MNDHPTEPLPPVPDDNSIGNRWILENNPFVIEDEFPTEPIPVQPRLDYTPTLEEQNPIAYKVGVLIAWMLIAASGLAALAFLLLMIIAIGSIFV